MQATPASLPKKSGASTSLSSPAGEFGDLNGSVFSQETINERLRILNKHRVRNSPVNLVSRDGRSKIEIEFEGRLIRISILEETPVNGNFRETFNFTFSDGILRYAGDAPRSQP